MTRVAGSYLVNLYRYLSRRSGEPIIALLKDATTFKFVYNNIVQLKIFS